MRVRACRGSENSYIEAQFSDNKIKIKNLHLYIRSTVCRICHFLKEKRHSSLVLQRTSFIHFLRICSLKAKLEIRKLKSALCSFVLLFSSTLCAIF